MSGPSWLWTLLVILGIILLALLINDRVDVN
jgi:hypothetical protein